MGVQSTVDWRERGVVTGTNIFALPLGQSVGAAIFGAIFNTTIAAKLADAPAELHADLPRDINAVIGALHHPQASDATVLHLRESIYTATHHV